MLIEREGLGMLPARRRQSGIGLVNRGETGIERPRIISAAEILGVGVKLQIGNRLRIDRRIAAVAKDQRQRRRAALDPAHQAAEAGGAMIELHPSLGERQRIINR